MGDINILERDTKEVIVNGEKVTIVFSEKENPDALEEVKRILTASFIRNYYETQNK